jgi:hypothetical protein
LWDSRDPAQTNRGVIYRREASRYAVEKAPFADKRLMLEQIFVETEVFQAYRAYMKGIGQVARRLHVVASQEGHVRRYLSHQAGYKLAIDQPLDQGFPCFQSSEYNIILLVAVYR